MERYLKKRAEKRSWYKRGGYESYIMVPSTPGSSLKKIIEKRLKTMNLSKTLKVNEKPGQKFIDVMKMSTKKDKIEKCNDPDCLMKNSKKSGNCRVNRIVYKIQCNECKDKYIGETSRNGHVRGIEHVTDSKSQDKKKKNQSY